MLKQQESELLSAYLDKELSAEELAQVKQNLISSVEWREELERLQNTKNLAMALPAVLAPLDLLDMLENQADKISNKRQFPVLFNFWAMTGSFATAALVVVSIGVHRMHQNSFLPLEPLLAAHSRSQSGSLFHQRVATASLYSAQLKKHAQN